jgi:hypothetical protein
LQSLQWNISDQMTEYWLKRNIGTTAARGLSCRLCTEAVRAECDSRDTFAHCDFLREANIHVVSSQRPLSVRFRRVPAFSASLIQGRKSEPDPKQPTCRGGAYIRGSACLLFSGRATSALRIDSNVTCELGDEVVNACVAGYAGNLLKRALLRRKPADRRSGSNLNQSTSSLDRLSYFGPP